MRPAFVPYIVILLFVSAAITSNLGVFAIIGGFVIGVALHARDHGPREHFAATPLIGRLMKGQERRVPTLGEPSAARG